MNIKSIILKFLPNILKDLVFAYGKQDIAKKLLSLPISNSGLSAEGIPFVKLKNGLIFFGYLPTRMERYIYKYFLSNKMKKILSEEAFAVALNILNRYIGPEDEEDYIKNGKYYNLKVGSNIVECGAYIGYYAMRAAQIVGKSGCIVAIEPVEENLKLLSMNVEINSFENIIIIQKAIWKKRCVRNLLRDEKQKASLITTIVKPNENIRVDCDTIDNILKELDLNQVDFIRIQINGAEIEALAGMTEILKKGPKLLIAAPYVRNRKQSFKEVISILHKSGYSTLVEEDNVFAWKN